MVESKFRRARRVAWGVVLSLVVPGLGLIFARAWWWGLGFLLLDEALSIAALAITQALPPAPGPLEAVLGILAAGLVLHLVVAVVVARRLRSPRPPVPWFARTWVAGAVWVVVAVLGGAFLPGPGWRSFSVPSGSMVPTLEVGDIFLADIRAPGTRPAPADVVVFAMPDIDGTVFVKRVVGLPGDRVAVLQGHLTINGRPTAQRAEPTVQTEDGEARRYVETLPGGQSFHMQKLTNDGPMNDTTDYVVPPGNLFMMGDNRDNSLDSRSLSMRMGGSFGYVPIPNVLGTARLLFWPPSRALLPVQ